MNTTTRFRQLSYKHVLALLAASLSAFTTLGQVTETANPSTISPDQLRQLLAAPAWVSADSSPVLVSTDSASAEPPRYGAPAYTPDGATPVPDSLKTTAPISVELYRNAVRLDVGGILIGTVASNALGNRGLLLPLLVAYERQLNARFSVLGEVLLNGGDSWERKAGFAAQGRYYFLQSRRRRPLAGFYAAPVLAYRSVQISAPSTGLVSRRYLGTGFLLGGQAALRRSQRWFLDVSAGVMSRRQVGQDKIRGSRYGIYGSSPESYYDTHKTDFDGRLGIGFRF